MTSKKCRTVEYWIHSWKKLNIQILVLCHPFQTRRNRCAYFATEFVVMRLSSLIVAQIICKECLPQKQLWDESTLSNKSQIVRRPIALESQRRRTMQNVVYFLFKNQVPLQLKLCVAVWRHQDATVTSLWRVENFQTQRYHFFVYQKEHKRRMLWCLHWLFCSLPQSVGELWRKIATNVT